MTRKNKFQINSVIIAILAGSITIGVSVIYTSFRADDQFKLIEKNGEQFVVETVEPITLTVVSDKNCENCKTVEIENWLRGQLGNSLAFQRIDYLEPKGKAILTEYNGSYLPFLLLGNEVIKSGNFDHLAHHAITKVKDRYLVDLEKMGAPIGRYLNVAYYQAGDASAPKLITFTKEKNLGEVRLSDGQVQTEFKIKNIGANPLIFLGLDTSCGCTSAQVVIPSGVSPIYQMAGHGDPIRWRGELAVGEEGKIIVFYDPGVHPDLTGDVMREIYIKTNDPNVSQETLNIFVNQSPA